MEVFKEVESVTGPHEQWPACILRYLFCQALSNVSRIVLAVFFFGNGINVTSACLLLSACNPYWHSFCDSSVIDYYVMWRCSEDERKKRSCYNVRRKLVLDLNDDISVYTL